jgi:2'-5' RNA ligase
MEVFTQKWAIISLLEDAAEGDEFHYTEFPLHVTLAGVFAISKSGEQLAQELTKILENQKPFPIKADQQDMFGPGKDVAVMRIHKTPELMKLYESIHGWLMNEDATFNSPEYQGTGYLPHSTFQKSGSLAPSEERRITSVSLVDLFPNNDGYKRKIYKTIILR